MRKIIIMAILIHFFNVFAFADNNDIYNIIYNKIYEFIEWKYINNVSYGISSRHIRYYGENDKDEIYINIYFNAGIYELKNYFNDIIEEKLLIELKNLFPNYDIGITLYYPFNIVFKNNFNYELEKRQNIINDVSKNTYGIILENIFVNALYGYFEDNYFCNLVEIRDRVNKLRNNNFNKFLEVIYKYYGKENIINF
jgi:hypothetical protein